MKIKPLEKHNGKWELEEIPEKINEIIEFLNNSFLTHETGDLFVESLTCDTLVPKSNEFTYISDLSDLVEHNLLLTRCPNCESNYYMELGSTCTLVNYPTIYKDGKNVTEDHNTSTTEYKCLSCGHMWKETT